MILILCFTSLEQWREMARIHSLWWWFSRWPSPAITYTVLQGKCADTQLTV